MESFPERIDRDGALLDTGRSAVVTIPMPGGGAEQDAEDVWRAVVSAADEALASCPNRGEVRG